MTVSNWARRLNLHARRRFPEAADLPALIMITDQRRNPDPLASAARLPRGSAVLLRDYDLSERAQLARDLARLCRRRHLLLLVAGDPRLAAKVGADGVHLSESSARRVPRHNLRRWRLVTAACHGAAALRRAAMLGADACLLSPAFETASHPGARPLGPWRFAALVRRGNLPVYALGGIDRRTIPRLINSRACGIAAIAGLAKGA